MKIKGIVNIIAALSFCAVAALSRAQCPTLCDGAGNTAVGVLALLDITAGQVNTALGVSALKSNTTGNCNTASGGYALYYNTSGYYNTADGFRALNSNTTSADNTAIGYEALYLNSTGSDNTASGYQALYTNTTGAINTATGENALYSNTTGPFNTADGGTALYSNTTGFSNTASGFGALYLNTTGYDNAASGVDALFANTAGFDDTAEGVNALQNNTTGSNNIALGYSAGVNLTTGNNNIDIGNGGVAAESNTNRIGTSGTQTATYIAGIYRVAIAGAIPVGVNSSGQLGVRASSARFKENIQPMDKASEAILSLRPVTFQYKKELDPKGVPQFGLVAEQVAQIDSDLVLCDDQGKPFTVRYDEVNAMLLNEFLKEHRRVEQLEAALACQKAEFQTALGKQRNEQQDQITALTKSLKEQAAQIQQIGARITTAEANPRVAATAR